MAGCSTAFRSPRRQVGAGGGLYSPAGDAVACSAPAYCYFYAPGPRLQYAPLVFTTDMTAWGLGTPGLSAHLNMRMNFNAGDEPFAGTVPEFQLWEGYVRYQHDWFMVQAGRQTLTSRLGFSTFDGGRATLRYARLGLEATGYVGIGLARASSVGINNLTTSPLDDYIPAERNLIAGVVVGLNYRPVEARFEWQRQVDRTTDYLMSDYLTGNAVIHAAAHFALAGGMDYDLAQAQVGSADAELRYSADRLYVTGGYKRYVPRFDLWTIWPAFSPVPWNGVQGSVQFTPWRWLTLRGRIQWYDYENSGAEAALGSASPTGMLWAAGATVTALPRWTFDAGWMYDNSFGAATAGGDASVGWAPVNSLVVRMYGAYSSRPLVYRYEDTYMTWAGLDVSMRATAATVGRRIRCLHQPEREPARRVGI